MTRIIQLISALCFAASAQAQTTVAPPIGRDCAPAQKATTTTASVALADVTWRGNWVAWWCSDGVQWQARTFWVPHEDVTPAMRSDMLRLVADRSLITEAEVKRMVEAHVTVRGPAPEWVDREAIHAIRPPAPVWAVAKSGTATTRPMYPLINGAVGKTSRGRVTINNTLCDCMAATVLSGATRYCQVSADATGPLVTICTRLR